MGAMAGPHRRRRPVLGLVVALTLALGWGLAPPSTAAASDWGGSINLYRSGVFTTQKSWLWCTAAGVQIIRNIVDRKKDHSTRNQRRYFRWMRERNRYDLPVSAGVDPQGWAAGLRHYVDPRYKLVASRTFESALRKAVLRMRKTNLPVALTVSRGNHGWVLHGFAATADPLTTDDFKVTSVRVTGPLYGLQSRTFGYDMKPNKKLTTAQLKRFFTPWRYAPKRMIWDGKYVSIQPVTPRGSNAAAAAAATPATATAPASMPSSAASSSISPSPSPAATPTPQALASPSPVGAAVAIASPDAGGAPSSGVTAAQTGRDPPFVAIAATGAVAVLALGMLLAFVRARRARAVGSSSAPGLARR
jgi:hypothetical protein